MPPTTFTYSSADGLDIAAYHWQPVGTVRGIVQLTHGMGEHALRYEPFATVLTERGFAVVAQDHRGHGASAASSGYGDLGPAGWPGLVADIGLLGDQARALHPDLPLILFGHSMGSFAAQQYALDHSAGLAGLALTGTAALDVLEPALDLDQPLDLAMFNAPFAPARTDFDWLSRDDAQVDLYVADPQCGFGLAGDGAKQMFIGARAVADPARIAAMRADLPVYLAVGDRDPVNGGLALFEPLVERYRAQLDDLTVRVYAAARHEVLNETNRDEVVADFMGWLDRVVPA